MSSVNPVFLMPHALAARAEQIGAGFAAAFNRFAASAAQALQSIEAGTMLTAGIATSYRRGVDTLCSHSHVTTLARNEHAEGKGAAALFKTSGAAFLAQHELHGEVFGPASLLVACRDLEEMREVTEILEGQLTATLQIRAGHRRGGAIAAAAGAQSRPHPGQRFPRPVCYQNMPQALLPEALRSNKK